jgi:LacI family transcriptional regulator
MAKIMVKIADVARLAGVSQSTASFVLNGHGDQMQISSETQERVWKAAKELNYKPSNLSHRIRSPKTKGVPAITIFWTVDRNFGTLTRTFISLHESIYRNNFNAEINLKPFVTGQLADVLNNTTKNFFSGAIIGGASAEDIESVENMESPIPVVFVGRNSKKCNCVYMSNNFCAELTDRLKEKGFQSVAVIPPNNIGPSVVERIDSIKKQCRKRGIGCRIMPSRKDQSNFTIGKETTQKLMTKGNPPDLLFFLQEELATGGIDALRELGLKGGHDVELVSIYVNTYIEHLGMPITLIKYPYHIMADKIIEVLLESMDYRGNPPQNAAIDGEIIFDGRLLNSD